jgi:hypothetical protein
MKTSTKRGSGRLGSMLLCAASLAQFSLVQAGDDFSHPEIPTGKFDPSLVEAWKEAEVTAPAYPADADLVPVALGPTDRLKLFVDTRSVSRAADRVLRMTLVVESPSGARSVFFDGFRCEHRQYKTYAIGAPDGRLVAVPNAKWQLIPRVAHHAFREFLRVHYVCVDSASARAPSDFLQRVQQP